MNSEVAVIDVIERILSEMLPDELSRTRVISYFYDKYKAVEGVPDWEGEGSMIGTPAIRTMAPGGMPGWGSP